MTADATTWTRERVSAEIAKARGWTFAPASADGGVAHWRPASVAKGEPLTIDLAWFHSVRLVMDPDPPPFASSWALAGPLLEEMAGPTSGACVVYAYDGPGVYSWVATPSPLNPDGTGAIGGESAATPTEAIARAWLAARIRATGATTDGRGRE